ncbi:DUF2079 domain-containing protein [Antribacter gilvus]|uniref:DUF2079 domain-containing protein n=1 Tax=Antribacter gilvus TaxID=2304675 RepID=UPI000F76E227|nr:DUF2079 domain-containing protein [Antribacter gilvus]
MTSVEDEVATDAPADASADGPADAPADGPPEEGTGERQAVPWLRRLRGLVWPAVVGAIVLTGYCLYSVWQWNSLTIKSWDLGIFTQVVERYAALSAPIVPIKGEGYNLLGDHFHPLLAVLGPVYAVFPHPFTLLVVQNVCFAVAAGIVTWSALRHLGPVSGVVVGLAFGASWGLQFAVEAQFHEVALGIPLLAGSLAAVVERRAWWAVVWAAPLVFVKEDLGLTVVAIGGVLVLMRRWRPGLALIAWGCAWFAIAVLVVLPALNHEGAWAYGEQLDSTSTLADHTMLLHPDKTLTVLLLVAATAGFVLRSPIGLVLLPTLGWRFLSDNEVYWGLPWHYNAILMPIAFLAAVDGVSRAVASPDRRWRTWGDMAPWVIGAAAVGFFFFAQAPLRVLGTAEAYITNPRAATVEEILAIVPDDASVVSDVALMNYLVGTGPVYWLGHDNPTPDYVVVGDGGGTPTEWGDALGVAQVLHPEADYELALARDGYSVARRTGS